MAKIDKYSHHFVVSDMDNFLRQVVERFLLSNTKWSSRVVGWSNGRPLIEKFPDKAYGAHTHDKYEFRFHINQWADFRSYLYAEHKDVELEIVEHEMYEPQKCEFKIKKGIAPREHQIPLIEYIVSPLETTDKCFQRVAILQTGGGKTLSSLFSVAKIGTRTILILKGGFVKQWVDVVMKTFEGFKKGRDILTIQGSGQLVSLMHMALEGTLEAKFIIMTNKTMQMYIQDYLVNKHEFGIYPIPVYEFYEKLKIGLRINDEVHMHFHLNFLEDLFTHVPLTLGLSATLTPDDPFMEKMYKTMFPEEMRFKGIPYNKYAHAISLHYRLKEKRFARYKGRGMGYYSHHVYEEWMMKNKKVLNEYLRIIDIVITKEYISSRKEGEKMLVFAASVEFCTMLTDIYKKKYPHLKVHRYCESDPFEKLLTGDLIFSTLISSGTAVDIPGLTRVFMTTALGSGQLNEQAFGRLRKIETENGLRFIWLTCDDIKQHVDYDIKKKELLADKALSIHDFDLNIAV